ncbi:MAG: type IV secretion system protein [Bryobacteraceae bacterium]
MRKLSLATLAGWPAAGLAQQQGPIPVNSQTIDYISPVTSAINALVTADGGVFLSTGTQILTWIGVIMLVIYGLKWAAHSASRHHPEFEFPAVLHFFALFLVAEALLRYYNVPLPLPGASSNVHQLFPETGRQLAATIDISTLNTLLKSVQKLISGEERPAITDGVMIIAYYGILVDMILIEGVLFALNILAFVMVGIGSLLGPLFIPWLIVPRLSWLFWNWIQFMLQYSFFQVIAAALTNVWATVLVNFLSSAIHGDYTLAHLLTILLPLGLLNVGFAVCIFKAGSIVSDLFKGAAAAGASLGGSVAGALRGAFR